MPTAAAWPAHRRLRNKRRLAFVLEAVAVAAALLVFAAEMAALIVLNAPGGDEWVFFIVE